MNTSCLDGVRHCLVIATLFWLLIQGFKNAAMVNALVLDLTSVAGDDEADLL